MSRHPASVNLTLPKFLLSARKGGETSFFLSLYVVDPLLAKLGGTEMSPGWFFSALAAPCTLVAVFNRASLFVSRSLRGIIRRSGVRVRAAAARFSRFQRCFPGRFSARTHQNHGLLREKEEV